MARSDTRGKTKRRPRSIDTTFFGLADETAEPQIVELPLDMVSPNPDQPRRHFDDETLRELADSIERHGLIQPISVMDLPETGYVIVAGERRFRAHQLLERPTIQALVLRDGAMDELALIENVQRQDLTPLEEAEAYRNLMERHGYSQGDVAEVVGKGRTVINRALRLNTLADAVKDEVRARPTVSKSVLLEISRVSSTEEQLDMWRRYEKGDLTVRKARRRKSTSAGTGGVRRRTPGFGTAVTTAKRLHEQLESLIAVEPTEAPVGDEEAYRELTLLLRRIRETGLELVTKVSTKI